jgi:peroxiredoxin
MKTSALGTVLPLLLLLPGCKWAFERVSEVFRHVERYDNGVTKKEGLLVDGEQSGQWTFYYKDGRIRSQGDYKDDHQVGEWKSYYENGHVEWTGRYDEKGARTGLWTFYYDGGGRRAEGRFGGDLEQGRWTFFDQKGVVQRVGDFLDARMVGWWSYRGSDGKPVAEGLVYDGVRVGPWTGAPGAGVVLHPLPNGLLLARETWPDGSQKRTGLLRSGVPVAGWASFHQGGGLRMSCVYRDGSARSFSCAGSGDEPFAEGIMEGNDLIAWSTLRDGARAQEGRSPLPPVPPGAGEWSAADTPANKRADETIAIWLGELRAPAAAAPAPPAAVAAPAPAEKPAPAVAENTRIAAPKQPDWTVLESKELNQHVQEFLAGSKQAPASHSRYAVPEVMRGKARRRSDLEGHELPIEALVATDGAKVRLADYRGKKRVLIVVLRGFFGQVCVYCVAQTEALAQCRDRFAALNLEVLILYPGPQGNEQAFLAAYQEQFGKGAPPYRVFYDPDLQTVKQLGIEGGDLAYPTTIFVDDHGIIRYAYTGAHRADRPAAEELIKFIRNLDSK